MGREGWRKKIILPGGGVFFCTKLAKIEAKQHPLHQSSTLIVIFQKRVLQCVLSRFGINQCLGGGVRMFWYLEPRQYYFWYRWVDLAQNKIEIKK